MFVILGQAFQRIAAAARGQLLPHRGGFIPATGTAQQVADAVVELIALDTTGEELVIE